MHRKHKRKTKHAATRCPHCKRVHRYHGRCKSRGRGLRHRR